MLEKLLRKLGYIKLSKVSLYDEEGIEGWEWTSYYASHEYTEIGDWGGLPTIPEQLKEIADELIAQKGK